MPGTSRARLRKSVIHICLNTNQITAYYQSLAQASKENNILSDNISNACSGVRNKAEGHKWAYGDDPAWKDAVSNYISNASARTYLTLNVIR